MDAWLDVHPGRGQATCPVFLPLRHGPGLGETGCSSFGYLTALELAGRGHTVFATVRDIAGKNAVVDALVELAEAPAGERPVRTVGGVDFGVRELNRAAEPFRQAVLEGIGMPDLDRLPTRA